jgi:predicted permease
VSVVLVKLLVIFAIIAIGWLAGRFGMVRPEASGVLAQATFGIFTPALLFRTTAGISVTALPWEVLAAYFVPTLVLLLGAYAWRGARAPAAPIAALSVCFSNTVQLGVPIVSALYGAAGLAVLVAIISLQSLVLLTTATILVEVGTNDGRSGAALRTARRSLIHPVVLPIILGLSYHSTGAPLPGPVDDVLATLGAAVVPVSLVTIGLTLRLYGVRGSLGPAAAMATGKLIVHPVLVLAMAYGVFRLRDLPLVVAVLCAALPTGANVLLFANRYGALQAETTATIVTSTSAFLVTGTLWLLILAAL